MRCAEIEVRARAPRVAVVCPVYRYVQTHRTTPGRQTEVCPVYQYVRVYPRWRRNVEPILEKYARFIGMNVCPVEFATGSRA